MTHPNTRFKEFYDSELIHADLSECFDERNERSGDGELIAVTIGSGVVKASDLKRKDNSSADKSKYKVIKKGDLAYNTMRMWQGACGLSQYDGIVSPAYTVIIPNNNLVDAEYFSNMFKTDSMIRKFKASSQGMTSDTWNLKYSQFSKIKVTFPSIEEQKKIARFLRDVKEIINTSNKEIDKLKAMKSSLIEDVFSGKIRFKKDNGESFPEWTKTELYNALEIHTEKNTDMEYSRNDVLSVSDEVGLVNQISYQGRSFAAADVSGYKKVRPNEIVYTKSPLAEKPFGIIKISRDEHGIISPLYIVNKVKTGFDPFFIYYYFDTPERTNAYLKPLARLGAKHTINISNSEWLSGTINVPCEEEQRKISDFFKVFDELIQNRQESLNSFLALEKGLLQQLFIN